MDKTFIIAEAGVNHNGDLGLAKRMIAVAKRCGADAVKFQTFVADRLVVRNAAKAGYQKKNTSSKESQYDMLKKLELSPAQHRELMAYAKRQEILFLSTPFDEKSSDLLGRLGMAIFKIPSGEITNKCLIQHIARMKKDIILSTGMAYLSEVRKAVKWIYDIWGRDKDRLSLTLLHCVSAYPALPCEVNLKAMDSLRRSLALPVGYSDHTPGTEIPVAAAARGACVIEKHFTLSRRMKGPDHRASLEPVELKRMVSAIRNVEKAVGDGVKRPSKSEEGMRLVARRSIVAARDIKKGKIINAGDVTVKRPGTGIPPERIDEIIGKKAATGIAADSLFRPDYVKKDKK